MSRHPKPPSREASSPESVAPALETRDLTKDYGDVVALHPISLRVQRSERIALIGHNGSGKTTLLRIVAGLLDASGGSARVFGDPPGSIASRRHVSYLADTPVFYEDLSVREHLEYVARMHGAIGWEERADDLLGRLGILDRADDLPSRFSRGLRQKAAIAVAFIRPFDLLLVDEPFVGLDAAGKDALLALFDDAAAAGATLVVATHELSFVDRVPRIVALRDGRLIHDGSSTDASARRLVTAEGTSIEE
jgi:ABC-type multidrug transport system ATPase subunit